MLRTIWSLWHSIRQTATKRIRPLPLKAKARSTDAARSLVEKSPTMFWSVYNRSDHHIIATSNKKSLKICWKIVWKLTLKKSGEFFRENGWNKFDIEKKSCERYLILKFLREAIKTISLSNFLSQPSQAGKIFNCATQNVIWNSNIRDTKDFSMTKTTKMTLLKYL